MSETWTEITTQDDPATGHRAVEDGRVYRDNDDCLTRTAQIFQRKATAVSGFNNTFSTRTATGIKIRFFKPAFVKKVSFKYWIGFEGIGSRRIWAVVRFNNNGSLETPLADNNGAGTGSALHATVTDFDLSSLAEGIYEAEIYAGHDGAGGDNFSINFPAGRDNEDASTPSGVDDNSVLELFNWNTMDWSTSPASDIVNATHLTADKGHTSTVGKMWYDRDEKLRRQPAGFVLDEVTESTTLHTSWADKGDVAKIYVPRWADVLRLQIEMKVSGGTGRVSINPREADDEGAPYSFWSDDVNEIPTTTSATYEFKQIRINVSRWRGQVIRLRLRMNISTSSTTVAVRALQYNQGHQWEVGPIPSMDPIAIPWRPWASEAYSQWALLHAAWWRRMTSRDSELRERQMLQRYHHTQQTGAFINLTILNESRIKIYQPKGARFLWATCEYSNSGGFVANGIKLDYTDAPDGDYSYNGVRFINVLDGVYEISREARADRDGTVQEFAIWVQGGRNTAVFDVKNLDRARMRWSIV